MSKSQPSPQQALRQHYRALRQQLSATDQEQAARRLLTNCMDLPALASATKVTCYLSYDGEINPQYLVDWCWQQHKTVLLPIIHPGQPGHLLFIEYRADSTMRLNQYGIAEPQYLQEKIVPLTDIDIIFTPLVAFDAKGNRLGMGGGYYDRTLAALSGQAHTPQVLGLAHHCQQHVQLPVQKWDFALQGIVTDSQIFSFC